MRRLGIISDTHGQLRSDVTEVLQDCDAIFHSGDFDKEEILEALEKIAPVYAVCGNNDDWTETHFLPETLSIELYGIRFFMVHDKKMMPADITDFDVVIYGHSHRYEETYNGRQLLLNPGSCGPRRFHLPVTMALLEIAENGLFRAEKIELEKQKKGILKIKNHQKPSDMKQTIEWVVKDTDKGININKIAARHHICPELAEQICRLYLTHPGVDAEGIMKKMENR